MTSIYFFFNFQHVSGKKKSNMSGRILFITFFNNNPACWVEILIKFVTQNMVIIQIIMHITRARKQNRIKKKTKKHY